MEHRSWRQTRTSGGSRETDVNELTVTPTGVPSDRSEVTIVTPVAKRLQAPRKSQVLQTRVCVVSILSIGVRNYNADCQFQVHQKSTARLGTILGYLALVQTPAH